MTSKRFNNYVVIGNTVLITVINKKGVKSSIIIDKDDLPKVSLCRWCLNSAGYPYNSVHGLLYHQITGKVDFPRKVVDHINHNPLDNRKSNLRLVSQSENLLNMQRSKDPSKNNKSGHTGVYWYPNTSKWVAQITINKKQMNLGYFKCIEGAIEARSRAEMMKNKN